ncbi:TPA: hypothetical protein PXM30_001180 [Yersinia enterocolitica]|nr:hypothetical protein [Yersinia enterocolitica]
MIDKKLTLHMSEASTVFSALKDEKISETVNRPELGPMGATIVEVWTSKLGGTMEFHQGNGGCSLYLKPLNSLEIPEGWKLVPEQITQEMAVAAKWVDGRLSVWKYSDVYRAMLYAAPEKPL